MRIAYLDCFSGISGDMLLGALVDAGVPRSVLEDATAALQLAASLRFETVDRSGISATKVHVVEGGYSADRSLTHSSFDTQPAAEPHQIQPQIQHQHKGGHSHTSLAEETPDDHSHIEHAHGRSLTVIRGIIQNAGLPSAVKSLAIKTFELLGRSEAKIHNVDVEKIHFHEVGAVDAIVDIVACSAGIVHLRIGEWHSSPVNVGGGTVVCAHGTFPVPAPAAADLLRGVPTYSANVQKELVTPTGAALLRALNPHFGPQPAMAVEQIGYGAGTRNPPSFPNVLRLSVGTAHHDSVPAPHSPTVHSSLHQTVTVLETAIDDSSPQVLAYVSEQALKQGALDVMLTPVIMKKGRLGTLLSLLVNPEDAATFEQLLLRETTTLGVRIRQEQRVCLDRARVLVDTPYGPVPVKTGSLNQETLNISPEYEDCRRAATENNVPLKQVQAAALAAYRERSGSPLDSLHPETRSRKRSPQSEDAAS